MKGVGTRNSRGPAAVGRFGEFDGGKEGTMRLDERLEYLLRAAMRAERNGDLRVAQALRRMAEDIRPIDRSLTLPLRKVSAA
jgi:hypothetical protein